MVQATDNSKSVLKVKATGKPSESVGRAVENAALLVLIEVLAEDSRSSVSKVPRYGAEDAAIVALSNHIQDLFAENDEQLSCRAGEKKVQMNTVLKLCAEKKKLSGLEMEV